MPQRACVLSCRAIRVKRVNAVMHRRDIHNVMHSGSRNRDRRQIKRLSDHRAIDRLHKELSELHAIYVFRSQNGFVGICPRTRIVIVPSRDRNLRHADRREKSQQNTKQDCANAQNSPHH